jgi:hypothetical protein
MPTEQQELAEAVAAWLHYKSLTGLSGLLTEASMTLPIAEYLYSKHRSEIHGEREHPLFAKGARGRPKQVDFVRLRRGDKTSFAAYECKFRTTNQELIVADICRLVCLAQCRDKIGSPERYFILSNKLRKGSRLLDTMSNTGEGSRFSFFGNLLLEGRKKSSFEANSFKLLDLEPRQKEIFQRFAKKNNVALPSIIVSQLVGWAVTGDDACGIWRITQERGSVMTSADDLNESG